MKIVKLSFALVFMYLLSVYKLLIFSDPAEIIFFITMEVNMHK